MGGMALCGCLRKVDKPFEKHPKKESPGRIFAEKNFEYVARYKIVLDELFIL
jgi:hypothetical protein